MSDCQNSENSLSKIIFPDLEKHIDLAAMQPKSSANLHQLLQTMQLDNVVVPENFALEFEEQIESSKQFHAMIMEKADHNIQISPKCDSFTEAEDEEDQIDEPVPSLAQACAEGDYSLVQYLIEKGWDVNEVTDDGETPLTCAVTSGNADIVQLLLKCKADPDLRGKKVECTALMEAASAGLANMVEMLLSHESRVSIQSNSGNTALHYASSGGHLDCVKLLVEKDPTVVEVQNENGHTPLMDAASNGFAEVADVLLMKGANINAYSTEFKESALTLASYKGHVNMVRFLLKHNAELEHRTDEMHTPLMEAAMDGHVEVAHILLRNGAQVNMPPDSFESPLTLAACGGHRDLAVLLLGYGADPEEVNDEGYTPLMEAAREGHEETVLILLVYGADVNAQTEETQETALTLAATGGFGDVCELLLRCGADLELGCSKPLMEAAQEGYLELVQTLIDRGADVNGQTNTNDTALHYACENGHSEVCRVLLDEGASLEHTSDGGRTPLMKASRAGNLACVKLFVERGAKVNVASLGDEHTPLSFACSGGHYKVVEYLLQNDADPMFQLKDGSTMVIEAARSGHTGVIQLLLDYPNGLHTSEFSSPSPVSKQLQPSTLLAAAAAAVNNASSSPVAASGVLTRTTDTSTGNDLLPRVSHHAEELLNQLQQVSGPLRAAVDGGSDPATTSATAHSVLNAFPEILQGVLELSNSVSAAAASGGVQGSEATAAALAELVRNDLLNGLNALAASAAAATGVPPPQAALDRGPVGESGSEGREAGGQSSIEEFAQWLRAAKESASASGEDKSVNCATSSTTTHQTKSSSTSRRQNRVPSTSSSTSQNGVSQGSPIHRRDPEGRSQPEDTATASGASSSSPLPSTSSMSAAAASSEKSESRLLNLREQQPEGDENAELEHEQTCPYHPSRLQQTTRSATACQTSEDAPRVHTVSTSTSTVSRSSGVGGRQSRHRRQERVSRQVNQHDFQVQADPDTAADEVRSSSTSSSSNGCQSNGTSMIDVNACIESSLESALTLACAGGHVDLVHLLLDRGANVEHRDKKSYTPLHTAVLQGQLEVVRGLLDRGANVEATMERNKESALSIACSNGKYEIVEELLQRGSNKEHRNVSDYTPLSLAASGGHVNVINLLLKHGAEINSRTGSKLGISPLMLAAMNGHTAAVRLLLDQGSDINAQIETNKNTALTLACFQGRHEVVNLLLEKKANYEHRAKTGLTPLMEAASGGFVEVAKVLLDQGADVNAPPVPTSRDTALTIAADKGHWKLVDILIEREAHVDARNKKGATSLWLACSNGHMEVVRGLVDAGADVNAMDNRKVSCLMAAFKKGHVAVVKLMVTKVNQYPADSDCERFIQLLGPDKDLAKKCEQCLTIIRAAKEKQEQEANKVAADLLKQVSLEKEDAARRQVNLAKKRERKRQKKKAKLGKEKTGKEEDGLGEEEDEPKASAFPSSERLGSEERRSQNSCEPVVRAVSEPPSDLRDTTCPVEPPSATTTSTTGHNLASPIYAHASSNQQTSTTSSKKKKGRVKELTPPQQLLKQTQSQATNGGSRESANAPSVEEVPSPATQKSSSVVEQKTERRRSKKKQNKANKKMKEEPVETVTSVVESKEVECEVIEKDEWMGLLEEEEMLDLDSWVHISGDKQRSGGEDQWKTVPKRKVSIPVSKRDIGRVIGQNGATVKALRAHTGAHIDIEDLKEGGENAERSIYIRGQPEAVARAKELIDDLISGKISVKDIASTSSPRRTSATVVTMSVTTTTVQTTTAAVKAVTTTVSSTRPATNKANTSTATARGFPIRKGPVAAATQRPMQSTQASSRNNNNSSLVMGLQSSQAMWGAGVASRDEMNFASVAAAGVVVTGASGWPSHTPQSSSGTPFSPSNFPTLSESINSNRPAEKSLGVFGNDLMSNSNISPPDSSFAANFSLVSTVVSANIQTHTMSAVPSHMRTYESQSAMPTFSPYVSSQQPGFSNFTNKSFARAPGSERQQRRATTPEQVNTFASSDGFVPSLSPLQLSSTVDGWGGSSGGSGPSSLYEPAPASYSSLSTEDSIQRPHSQHTPASRFMDSPQATTSDATNPDLTFSQHQYQHQSFGLPYQLPRVAVNLNPQAQAFSPANNDPRLLPGSQYSNTSELQGLPRVGLNPSASTFQPSASVAMEAESRTQQMQSVFQKQGPMGQHMLGAVGQQRYSSTAPDSSNTMQTNYFGQSAPFSHGINDSSRFSVPSEVSLEEYTGQQGLPQSRVPAPIGSERRLAQQQQQLPPLAHLWPPTTSQQQPWGQSKWSSNSTTTDWN